MIDGNEHREHVDAWMRAELKGLSTEQVVQRFEQVFNAIIRRAQQTLGEVTLMAILDRVVFLAAEKVPLASTLKFESASVCCQELLEHTGSCGRGQVVELIRLVLTSFLSLLGNLTADVFTPALHAELARTHETMGEAAVASSDSGDEDEESRHEQE